MAFRIYKGTRWLILLILITLIYSLIIIFSKSNTPIETIEHFEPTVHAAVVLALSKQTSHIAEFNLLYDSWRFIQNFIPLSEEVIIDLIIFCEQPSCAQIPSSCLPLSYNTKFETLARCFYFDLDPAIVVEWQKYLYMTSIAFMLTKEFRETAAKYDWLLRVDQDAVLSPGILYGLKGKHHIKLQEMQFGAIGHGTDFTHKRLETIAKKLGYKHAGRHNLCSTWLVHPQDATILANLTTKIGKHFLANEYGPNVTGIEDLPYIGAWPKWWLGVTSLYAAEIAINHVYFTKLGREHESSAIDHSADSGNSLWDAWHIHCLHNPGDFAKFRHRDELREYLKKPQLTRNEKMVNLTLTRDILEGVIKEFHQIKDNNDGKITGKIAVRQYVMALAWQKAYTATGAINLSQ